MKLLRMLANLGYGSRRDVTALVREGRVTDASGELLYIDDAPTPADVRIDGEPLDPPAGLALTLYKPPGHNCPPQARCRRVCDLLPPRVALPPPTLAPMGRRDPHTRGRAML